VVVRSIFQNFISFRLFYGHRLANLFIVKVEASDAILFAEVIKFTHKFLPIGLAASETLEVRSSSEDELTSVVEMHVESADNAVFTIFDSIIFSVIDFVANFEKSFQTKVEFDAFVKLLVDYFILIEVSRFENLD
jgi:hypothetical protein